jgi:hypothetical protein
MRKILSEASAAADAMSAPARPPAAAGASPGVGPWRRGGRRGARGVGLLGGRAASGAGRVCEGSGGAAAGGATGDRG